MISIAFSVLARMKLTISVLCEAVIFRVFSKSCAITLSERSLIHKYPIVEIDGSPSFNLF